jgi:hypothetical protein
MPRSVGLNDASLLARAAVFLDVRCKWQGATCLFVPLKLAKNPFCDGAVLAKDCMRQMHASTNERFAFDI